MKIGVRKPSIKRSIKAKTTGKLKRKVKSTINPLYGKKGMGVINSPEKAVYNKVYNKTTTGVNDIVKNNPSIKTSTKCKTNIENDSQIYEIINEDLVVISNKNYTKKSIKAFKNTFLFTSIILILSGIICLPVGLIFVIIGMFMYSMFRTYKKIYNEMLNLKKDTENNNIK